MEAVAIILTGIIGAIGMAHSLASKRAKARTTEWFVAFAVLTVMSVGASLFAWWDDEAEKDLLQSKVDHLTGSLDTIKDIAARLSGEPVDSAQDVGVALESMGNRIALLEAAKHGRAITIEDYDRLGPKLSQENGKKRVRLVSNVTTESRSTRYQLGILMRRAGWSVVESTEIDGPGEGVKIMYDVASSVICHRISATLAEALHSEVRCWPVPSEVAPEVIPADADMVIQVGDKPMFSEE